MHFSRSRVNPEIVEDYLGHTRIEHTAPTIGLQRAYVLTTLGWSSDPPSRPLEGLYPILFAGFLRSA